MAFNPANTEIQKLLLEAKSLLMRLEENRGEGASAVADDVLLFFYRLRDKYCIVRSSSKQFHGPTFYFLNGLLYGLESNPEETMQSAESRSVMVNLLNALVSGVIVVQRSSQSASRS